MVSIVPFCTLFHEQATLTMSKRRLRQAPILTVGGALRIRHCMTLPQCGQAHAVALLLSLVADSTLKNEFEQTALDVALLGNKVEVCKVLNKQT